MVYVEESLNEWGCGEQDFAIFQTQDLCSQLQCCPNQGGFWPELTRFLKYLPLCKTYMLMQKQQSVLPGKTKRKERKAFWMNFACERVLRKYWRMLMREAHCRMFPKHKETCALNIEESSGTVYLPAASHRLQISSNNLTCHFMVWYFCGTWKPQTPNTSDTHRTI